MNIFKKILDFYISTQALFVVLIVLTGAVIAVLLAPREKAPTSTNVRNTPEQSSIANTQASLTPGDLNGDNELSLSDYNILLSCFGGKDCSQKKSADLNSDGMVDEVDLNVFYSNLSKRAAN